MRFRPIRVFQARQSSILIHISSWRLRHTGRSTPQVGTRTYSNSSEASIKARERMEVTGGCAGGAIGWRQLLVCHRRASVRFSCFPLFGGVLYSCSVIIAALSHPLCVGLGEIGLDYHYNRSPHAVQKTVFTRQLKLAVEKGKPHDPYTKSRRTYRTDNEGGYSQGPPCPCSLFHRLPRLCPPSSFSLPKPPHRYHWRSDVLDEFEYCVRWFPESFRIVLETDAPCMVPSNVYPALLADPTL